MRRSVIAVMGLIALSGMAHAKRVSRDSLLSVVTPRHRADASAHPFVNVIVRFGSTSNGAPANPATFKARIGGTDVTDRFVDDVEDGVVVGKQAELGSPFVEGGKRARLRMSVKSFATDVGRKKPRVYRDGDVLRFRAVDGVNQPPVARAGHSSDVILTGIPMEFDASQSHDPDEDELDYLWDFGDGTTSTDRKPTHIYENADNEVTVRLTVSDGQASSDPVEFTLLAQPPCDGGALPGLLKVDGDTSLEFGPLPVGTTGTKTFTVRNVDVMPGTQVRAILGTDSDDYTLDPAEVTLGPSESMPITVTFRPSAAGHRTARIGVVACASSRTSVAFLAHGYGGDGSDAGPTFAQTTAYYSGILPSAQRYGIVGLQPNGRRFSVDNSSNWCVKANNTGTRDLCFRDADCAAADEHCISPAPFNITFDPSDFCADAQGNLFVLSEDTVSDPVGDDNEVTGTIARFKLDDDGNLVNHDIVRRITGTTNQLACDNNAAGDGGLLYMAEYQAIVLAGNCIRDAQEAFTGIRKGTGALVDFGIHRIDATETPPKLECDDDYDPVIDLAVSSNGNQAFYMPDEGGIYRLRPSPLPIIQTPTGGATLLKAERIQVHPDGALLYATSSDTGTTGNILIFKIYPEQAENGPLRLEDLTPCATFPVPNNEAGTVVISFAAERKSSANGATILVSFGTTGGGNALGGKLRPGGTVSFSSPDGSPTCTVNGLVNLELADSITF